MLPFTFFRSGSVIVIAALAFSLSVQAQTSQVTIPEPEISWVQLTSGEYIIGQVQAPTVTRPPSYVLVDGQRYAQHSIQGFRHDGQDYVLHTSMASPRPILLRQVSNGAVSLYTETASDGSPDFFRIEGGSIAAISNTSLTLALRDNPASLRYLQADRHYGTIATISLVAGAAVVGTGAAMEWGILPNSGSAGLYLATSGVLVAAGINAVIPMLRRNAKMNAIDAYNRSSLHASH